MTDQPQVNGPADGSKYIDNIDPEDPEYVRQMRRPADVKEDMRQVTDTKRVSLILQSQAFKEELEQIVSEQIKSGPHPASLLALQQISELLLPQARSGSSFFGGRVSGSVIPIADIRGVDSLNYSKGEKMLRCKTASLSRLIDMFGWSSNMQAYISVRMSQDLEHFLMTPNGVLFHEVTASNLVRVDMRADIVDPGTSTMGINKTAFTLHSAIHAARPDIKCIIHLRHPPAISISVMKCGLLPLSQEALSVGEICYYDYMGVLADQEEKDKLARALGPSRKVMFLRNYGIVIGGDSIDEAFHNARNIMTAIDIQLKTMPIGVDNIVLPPEDVRKKSAELANQVPPPEEGKRKWRRGEVEFEAYMRHLDNAGVDHGPWDGGYRTGHMYHEPLMKSHVRRDRVNSEVEVPPASSSFASYYEDDRDLSKYGSPLKQHMERQKKQFKSEWLNTPNVYKKEEIDEVGTANPKKITKWVYEDSPQKTSTPLKVESPNVFAPQGENPKELKDKVKEIRKEYYEEKITAGPQSRILEGMTWEEAQRIKDGHVSGTTDGMIVVGAASKGIIQRDHQHNAVVYKTYYAPNPFDSMSEEEIKQYKSDVEKRSQGDVGVPEGEELEPGPEGRLISSEERMLQVRAGQVEAPPQSTEVAQQVYPSRQYLETSLDDITDTGHYSTTTQAYVRPGVTETNIDDVVDAPTPEQPREKKRSSRKPKGSGDFDEAEPKKRSKSARYTPQRSTELVKELQEGFEREKSKSERKPKKKRASAGDVNGEQGTLGSPTKSTSSGDGTLDERSSREGSPTKELAPEQGSPEKSEKKKKKKFRIPSFSKKKDKKEKEAK